MPTRVTNPNDGETTLYYPFQPAPGGVDQVPVTTPPRQSFIHTQARPAATWIITHPLGYKPSVAVFIGDEEVEADVEVPGIQVVSITFSTPQAGKARLT